MSRNVWYVIGAYLAVTALFALYVWTLLMRQRAIAELVQATRDADAGGTSR